MMRLFRGISRDVVVLGWVSFFTDLASEMLYPIIPLFLTGTLGLPKESLGAIEGVAEGISTGLRWVGGVLSDLAQKRKPFVFWGYTLSAFSKPVMGLAALLGGWPVFLAGRSSDRLGKSIRTAARDALIADATGPEHRGAAFGLHRAMDTGGAVLGPLMALLILWLRPGTPLTWLFFVAFGPGIVSGLLVALFVRESTHAPDRSAAAKKARLWQGYSAPFLRLLLANVLFSLGNSSDSLLILRGSEVLGHPASHAADLRGAALVTTGLMVVFNVAYVLLAFPAGKLSDRLPRRTVIAAGWVVYAGVYAGFGFAGAGGMAWGLFAAYGAYQALTEGVTKAFVSDLVPSSQRAGAIGLYYTISGAGQLLASVLTGWLWDRCGPAWAFGVGAALALAAVPVLLTVPARKSAA
ncbi:MAG TPA: MFS transporter [Phycisphaerae bacterium]|jgi:MFS family permease|nr:MFS transporter [Phycisphaerae bacterium]